MPCESRNLFGRARAHAGPFRVLVLLSPLLLTGQTCAPAPVVTSPDPEPRYLDHRPTEETVVAASPAIVVLARAEYDVGPLDDQNQTTTPATLKSLKLVGITPATGDIRSLSTLFGGSLAAVPVSDGAWLVARTEDNANWLVDLSTVQVSPLVLAGSTQDTQSRIWAVSKPWLLVTNAGGAFVQNLTTGASVTLPDNIKLNPLALSDTHVAFLAPVDDGGAPELRVVDLRTGQSATVDRLESPGIFLKPARLAYIDYAEGDTYYDIRGYDLNTAANYVTLRLRQLTPPAHLFIAGISGSRYILLESMVTDEGYHQQLVYLLREEGSRELITGRSPQENPNLDVIGEPRLVASQYFIMRDTPDEAWYVFDLTTGGSRRLYPFR